MEKGVKKEKKRHGNKTDEWKQGKRRRKKNSF